MTPSLSLFASLPSPEPSLEGIDLAAAFASYSSDVIATQGKVRKPVRCNGDLWVSGGQRYCLAGRSAEMSRLVPLSEFEGETWTYHEKTSLRRSFDKYPGDFARTDPNGFYHGMRVKHGGIDYVLSGPVLLLQVDADVARALDAAETYATDEDEDEDDNSGVYDGLDDGGRSLIGDTPDFSDEEDDGLGDGVCAGCGVHPEKLDNHFYADSCGTYCEDCMGDHVHVCGKCMKDFGADVVFPSALPGMAEVARERVTARAEAEGLQLGLDMTAAPVSISSSTRNMETYSPLFRDSPANLQGSLFC